jgi:hypothetical protein
VDHNSTEAMACAMVLYPGNLIQSAVANSWKMLKIYEKNGVGNIGNRMEYVYCIMIYIYNGYKHVISIYPGTISNVP